MGVARHWLKLGSAGRAPGARAVYSVRAFRGFASRWAPRGLIGVLVASPRSANGRWWDSPLAFPSGYHRLSLWRARVRLRAARLLRNACGAVNGVLFIAGVVCIEPPPSNGARLPAE